MKKVIKRVLKVIAFILAVVLVEQALCFALIPVSFQHWANHDRDELAEKVDTVFVGDSLCMFAMQPSVVDEKLGCCSFNAATASQPLIASYYYLKDYMAGNKIKRVFLAVDYTNLVTENSDDIASNFIVIKRMNKLKIKAEFISEMLKVKNSKTFYEKTDGVYSLLFGSQEYTNQNTDVLSNIKNKLSADYRNYNILKNEKQYYSDKGYIYTAVVNNSDSAEEYDISEFSDNSVYWLKKIADMCSESGIELIAFQPPVKKIQVKAVKNYNLFYDKMQELSAEMKFRYFDFNIGSSELDDSLHFKDSVHLNFDGSCIFMNMLFERMDTSSQIT